MRKVTVLLAGIILGMGGWCQTPFPFTYKLLPTSNPQGQSNVKFICQLPASATNLLWDFGQGGGTSTDRNPEYSYNVSTDKVFTVKLSYTLSGVNLESEQSINVNPAFFRVGTDSNYGDLASLVRVFRSAFNYGANHVDSIGSMRYYWEVDGVRPPGNAFTGNTLGDYPNIYHRFATGGSHTVTLRVFHQLAPAVNFAEHTVTLMLEPDPAATKLNFENLPQFITPNGDQLNDYFEVASTGATPLVFMVFSRTGALVYQQEANVIRWDGTNYNGKDLPEGIYYYTIEDKGGLYDPAKGFFYIFRGK